MEQLLLETILGTQRTRRSSGVVNMGSVRGSHASPYLIAFCDETAGLVDEERTVDMVRLDFSSLP